MTLPSLNCLSAGETLADVIRREYAIGFDLRFCRSVAVTLPEPETAGPACPATLHDKEPNMKQQIPDSAFCEGEYAE